MSITPLCYTDFQRCEFTSSPGSQFNQLAVACAGYPVQYNPALWSTFAVNRYRNGTALECVPASPCARIGQSAAHHRQDRFRDVPVPPGLFLASR